jgi:anti-sigma B factor antagonist
MPQASVATSPTTASRPSTSAPFLCLCEAGSCAAWVHVAGELDLVTSPELDEVLQGAQDSARLVVLDLRALTFIDSSAVHVILHAAGRGRRTGGRLMLVRGPSQVDLVLTLTGASDKVSIFDLDAAEPAPAPHLAPRV